jgi:hypothetical protein
MAPIPSSQWSVLTPKTDQIPIQNEQSDPIEHKEMTYYELDAYNGKVLKFTMEKFGERPPSGYSVYIALHGGGGDMAAQNADKDVAEWRERSNNRAWQMMATSLYRWNFKGTDAEHPDAGVDGAIYIALRGIVNDWNMHFRPESYVLVDRLITKLLQPAPEPLANSNRIFLTGFSAGGDGSYRLAANLTDRLAAANASSGHPGDVVFENFANLPFCSQVGEKDPTVTDRSVYVVGASVNQLNRLESEAAKNGTTGLYAHDCFLYTRGWNFTTNKPEPADHSNWERYEDSTGESTVVKKEKLADWLQHNLKARSDPPADDLEWRNSNSITWLTKHERVATPRSVVWNLISRPNPPRHEAGQAAPVWEPTRFFYWLYLKDSPSKTFEYNTIIRASYNPDERWIQVDQPNDYTVLLINEAMFPGENKLGSPITVYAGPKDGKTQGQTITVRQSEAIRKKTFEARGDKKLEFSAMVYFSWNVRDGGVWTAKSADTLDPAEA